ncbi:LacI family DNA-binding transcriptional regulator [Cellulomonas hominis]
MPTHPDGSARRPTISEVARRAGVSPATVSRILNGRFAGEPAVAERVRTIMTELEYSPSPLARSLALGQTHTVAFVVPDLANPAFQGVLGSLSKAAGAQGYRVLVADSNEHPDEEPLLAMETRRRCDCVVLCAPRMPEDQLLAMLDGLRPVVIVNRTSPRITVPCVSIDYGSGIQALAQHLYDLGHRSILYLHGPGQSASNEQRERALAEFEHAAPDLSLQHAAGGAFADDGHAAVDTVLRSGATAVLAYNDLVAIGLLTGLRERGVSVPGDISVAGFDDISYSRYVSPTLTTASVPLDTLGIETWRRLSALIDGHTPEHNVLIQPRIEPRESTAAPRRTR